MPSKLSSRPARPIAVALVSAAAAASLAGMLACSSQQDASAPGSGSLAADGSAGAVGTLEDGGAASPPTHADGSTTSPPPPAADAAPGPTPATFLTLNTRQYLSDGDGGALSAASNAAGPGETFALTDLNGGGLASGDAIYLASGGSYLSAADGGGGALTFATASPGTDETFLLVLINDAGVGTPITAGSEVALQTTATGNYVSAINGGGGAVLANAPWDHAWETFALGLPGASAGDAGTPPASDGGTTASASARQKVLAFLARISGKQTAIGVEDKSGGEADSAQMTSMAGDGKTPSFWSGDWGFGSAADPSSREAIVQEGKKQWAAGAIVQYIYHACPLGWGSNEGCDYQNGNDPIKGSFGQLSDAQWTDLTTAGGTLNKVWLARLDVLATYFQELKDAGVAPLFRPLHEINGGWAWWQGRPGPTGSALLYQVTHDYLANTKGLDNIIWVWNVQDYTTLASDVTVYRPGVSYFDIAGLDIYDTGYTDGNYQAMVSAAAGKPIGVAECEFLPEPATLAAQPLWTYVAVWPDFLYPPYANDNTKQIPELFSDSEILTLSDMPGWK